ncbi:hypothetical protein QL285_061445 [Trifolium repens]|jgi:hypothetical protein|nr:hypothetical protein QL285_061445 [Trifolium repens]
MRTSNAWGVVVRLELSAWKREKHVLFGLFEFWMCCFVSDVAFVMLLLLFLRFVRIWRMVIVFVFLKEFEEKKWEEKEVMAVFLRRRSFNIAMVASKKESCVVAM